MVANDNSDGFWRRFRSKDYLSSSSIDLGRFPLHAVRNFIY